jgi:RNA 2',3'-cyclic 3'-phosphodiesterase
MRLFVALDIDSDIRERIARFMEGVRGFAPDARWVSPESLHITLKFIGEMPESSLSQIKELMQTIHPGEIQIRFRGFGFFPSSKSPRVFWIGIEAGPQLAALATQIDTAMAKLGVPAEEHAFSPHLTLARGAGRSGSPSQRRQDRPNKVFDILQKQLGAMPPPDFGAMATREFFLYQSQLSPKGSKYTKLERFT